MCRSAWCAMSKRASLIRWARWGVTNAQHFTYTMGAERWHMVESKAGTVPQWADCSSFVTACAKWAGCSDPNGQGFRDGYTGTLLEHCNHITAKQAQPGDLIVYGPGTGHHVTMIVGAGSDLMLVSHGHQGTPELIRQSVMVARQPPPVTFLRWLDPD